MSHPASDHSAASLPPVPRVGGEHVVSGQETGETNSARAAAPGNARATTPAQPLACEIVTGRRPLTRELASIARVCACDAGVPVRIRQQSQGGDAAPATVTLHLPAELAAAQHPVWCLACRLACFCPQARVSVLVHSVAAFRRRRRAQASPAGQNRNLPRGGRRSA